jgi:hypothetical protein
MPKTPTHQRSSYSPLCTPTNEWSGGAVLIAFDTKTLKEQRREVQVRHLPSCFFGQSQLVHYNDKIQYYATLLHQEEYSVPVNSIGA